MQNNICAICVKFISTHDLRDPVSFLCIKERSTHNLSLTNHDTDPLIPVNVKTACCFKVKFEVVYLLPTKPLLHALCVSPLSGLNSSLLWFVFLFSPWHMRWLCAAVCPVQFTGKRGKPSTQAKLFSPHPAATLTYGRKKMSVCVCVCVCVYYNTY